jgi:branched-chain amino acid aminotransferase
VTPVSEIGPYTFAPGKISRTLIDAYTAAVTPK